MNDLLTPEQTGGNKLLDAEQMRWIVERAFNADPSNVSARDCRKLLFHVEAIAERIEVMESGIRAGIETAERIYKEHNMPARVAARREYAESIADQLRALVTAIRGEK